MKPDFTIKKGMNLPLEGKPLPNICDLHFGDRRTVVPSLIDRRRWKTALKPGDVLVRNDVICFDRRNPEFSLCAPIGGIVEAVDYGEGRTIRSISFTGNNEQAAAVKVEGNPKEVLKKSGLFSLIKQRPFGHATDFSFQPRAVFINAMNTAPFQADPFFVTQQNQEFFKAGLQALKKMAGHVPVYLSCPPEQSDFWAKLTDCEIHSFNDLHPSGNNSIHISKIRPDLAGNCVWTVRAVDLPLIGELMTTGMMPQERLVAVGGPESSITGYVKLPLACAVSELKEIDGPGLRLVAGDMLGGLDLNTSLGVPFSCAEINVLLERSAPGSLLGWIRPGLTYFSRLFNPLLKFMSILPAAPADCRLHGSRRAPIFTGIYDRVMPLNIMSDFLLKAVLADDLEEAVALGLLETVPEDFALCEYLCPSKIPVQQLMRQALERAKEECLHETC